MRPRSQKKRPSCQLEALEGRQLMSASVANNTFDTATVVPDIYLEHNYNTTDAVNASTPNGFYKFYNLYGKSHLYATLNGMSSDADLFVFNQDKQQIASSEKAGALSETINVDLNAAQYYYVQVKKHAGGTTNFNLNLMNDYAGSTLGSARDIGASWGQSSENFWSYNSSTMNDYLDYRDNVDLVKFKMEAPGTISLRRLPVQNTAGLVSTMQLLDASGNVLATPTTNANSSIDLDRFSVPAGTYYVKFTQSSGAGQYYFRIVSDYAGDTTPTSRDLGDVTNTARQEFDMVGDTTSPTYGDATDLYKFKLSKTSPIDLKVVVPALGFSANLALARDTNNDGFIQPNEIIDTAGRTIGDHTLSKTLNAGTYYVVVTKNGAFASYELDLDSDLDANAGDKKAYSNMSKATNVGNLVGEHIFNGGFGISAGDFTDFYKFRMTANGQFNASAQTNTYWSRTKGDPNLVIVRDTNNNGRFDNGEQITAFATGTLSANLTAGNYFLRVANSGGQGDYYLRLVSNYAGSTLGTARKLAAITGNAPATQKFNDYIEQDFGTGSNPNDFFSFSLGSRYQATFSTTGVDGEDLSLSLIRDANNNGVLDASDVLATSNVADSPKESLTRTLDAGNYFVRVHGVNGGTNYELTANFTGR